MFSAVVIILLLFVIKFWRKYECLKYSYNQKCFCANIGLLIHYCKYSLKDIVIIRGLKSDDSEVRLSFLVVINFANSVKFRQQNSVHQIICDKCFVIEIKASVSRVRRGSGNLKTKSDCNFECLVRKQRSANERQ